MAATAEALEALRLRIGPAAGSGLRSDEPLRRYTSFRIGGPADLFLSPPDEETLSHALTAAAELTVPVTLIGGGTNLREIRSMTIPRQRERSRNWRGLIAMPSRST